MEIKALQERLEDVIANKKNQTCAECPNKFPQWAVLDRGERQLIARSFRCAVGPSTLLSLRTGVQSAALQLSALK